MLPSGLGVLILAAFTQLGIGTQFTGVVFIARFIPLVGQADIGLVGQADVVLSGTADVVVVTGENIGL